MWIRITVTGGIAGHAGQEDHNLDLDKLPADTRAELQRLVEAAGLHGGADVRKSAPLGSTKTYPDTTSFTIKVKGPKGDSEVSVSQFELTDELRALIRQVRAANSPKK